MDRIEVIGQINDGVHELVLDVMILQAPDLHLVARFQVMGDKETFPDVRDVIHGAKKAALKIFIISDGDQGGKGLGK
jgi:hypothetical protein